VPRLFYRIVKADPPTRRDFTSRREKGLPPRGPELTRPQLWSGISVFDTPERARDVVRRTRMRGLLARLEIPDDAPIRLRKTLGSGHYTLWGDPEQLLGYVVYPLMSIEE
jgi:hypothetical protein